MKLLKITIIAFILNTGLVIGQTNDEIINSFATTYELEAEGSYKEASDELKKVYSENSYEINLRLGWLTYNAGLFQESAAYYQNALNLKPYSEEAKFGLIYPKVAQGKWSEVVKIYKEILAINPSNTIANYRLGLIYFGQRKYTQANEYFEKVLNLYPFDYDSLIMLAWTNYYLGKNSTAKVLFNKALMNRPNDKSAKEGLGLLK